jgi:hypothetical protein
VRGQTNIWRINARYENNSIRQLLIRVIAGALQQMTYEQIIGPTNCFAIGGTWAGNVGNPVRVGLLPLQPLLASYSCHWARSAKGQIPVHSEQRTKLHTDQAVQ